MAQTPSICQIDAVCTEQSDLLERALRTVYDSQRTAYAVSLQQTQGSDGGSLEPSSAAELARVDMEGWYHARRVLEKAEYCLSPEVMLANRLRTSASELSTRGFSTAGAYLQGVAAAMNKIAERHGIEERL